MPPSCRVGSSAGFLPPQHACYYGRRLRALDWRPHAGGSRVAGAPVARAAERAVAGLRQRGVPVAGVAGSHSVADPGDCRLPGGHGRRRVAANTFVVDKARELGELRYEQRASVHQLLREYRVLSAILVTFVEEETTRLDVIAPSEVIAVLRRLSQAVAVLQQTTVETFIAKYTAQIDEQTRRLENFNRMVSHELRQPIGALQFAVKLAEASDEAVARAGYREVIDRNLTRLVRLTDQLAMMSRLKASTDTAQTQRLPLSLVAREVARQLRDMAERRDVEIRISETLPIIEVDVAAVELILVNLISNAIKYSDPSKPERIVQVLGEATPEAWSIVVEDNGMGIASEHLPRVFERAYRAHAERDEELGTDGFGLGLAIVSDCVKD